MASTKLTKTFSGDGNRQKYTISFWVKRSSLGNQFLFNTDGGNEETYLRFKSGDSLQWFEQNSSAATQENRSTNQLFRDFHGWYHIVITRDSTLSTANDRLKFYVNGTQITSWAEDSTPAQNTNTRWNKGSVEHMIGVGVNGSSNYFDGYMTHIHFCDGYAYQASDFGQTDSTTGIWKAKTAPSVNYGTNGYFILKNGNSVTDQSSNTNNWTVSGTLTDMKDCPDNVFCTMNPLDNQNQGSTFTIGNNKIEYNTNNKTNFATFAVNKGKWYWEMKFANNTGGNDAMIGVVKDENRDGSDWVGHDAIGWSYYASNGNKYTGGSGSSYGNSWTTNDIIGVAFDADTRTLWFSKNGAWQNSATISEIAAGTTTNSAFSGIGSAGEYFFPAMSGYDGNKVEFNFGNGYFSTTAITSAGSNASNIGSFEYDVPNNFTALCTKGLNE